MQTITVAMIVYCVAFAGIVVGIGVYRAIKRRREMQAFAREMKSTSVLGGASLPQPSPQSDSPHDTPSAKHAA